MKSISKKIVLQAVLVVGLLVNVQFSVSGQNLQLETDRGIAASIAPYDADVRQAILKVSQYPLVLTQLQKSQGLTVASFRKIIKGFRQSKQVWFYTLTRYPDVLHKLATLPDKQSKEDVLKLLPNKNADLQEAAWEGYRTEKKTLIQVDNAKIAAEQDFDKLIQTLDASAKAAFKKLSDMPDVLTLLTNNIDLTTRLGEHAKADPTELNNRLAAIHDSLNVESQYETAAFKKQMADDPKATAELSQAAKDYASENGYNPPTQQNDEMDNSESYYADPYSYWFGYPSWYASPLWYPDSFWYESGFYMGLGGFGFYGFPSFGFSYWFFNGGHYNRYPNLYHQFGNYYHNNMGGNRVMGGANHGFMSVANGHFNPKGGNQMHRLTSPGSYQRSAGAGHSPQIRGNTGRSNANSYHAQSWGSYGGRGNAVGGRSGGGGGGGSRGGGGGSHGGGGGGGHR